MEIPTEIGQPFASATWQVPNPTDNSNESVSLSGLLPPQKLDVGNKHITYIATDSAGLIGSCTFSIYVRGRICFILKSSNSNSKRAHLLELLLYPFQL